MSNKPRISIASDYAVLTAKNAKFYYGYERTVNGEEDGEGGEWCFVATIGEKEIVIPSSKLGVDDDTDVVECLMTGIGWILARYQLVIPETKVEK